MRTVAATRSSTAPDRGAVCGYLAGAIGALGEKQTTGTNKVRFRFPAAELQATPADGAARQPSCARSELPPCLMPDRHAPAAPAIIDGPRPVASPGLPAAAGDPAEAGCGLDTHGGSALQRDGLEGGPARLRPSVEPMGGSTAVLAGCRKANRLRPCLRPPAIHLGPRPARRGGDFTASAAAPGRQRLAQCSQPAGSPARLDPAYAAAGEVGKRTVRLSRRKVFNEKGNADQRPPARREPHRHH